MVTSFWQLGEILSLAQSHGGRKGVWIPGGFCRGLHLPNNGSEITLPKATSPAILGLCICVTHRRTMGGHLSACGR